jgi:hypothetical protein
MYQLTQNQQASNGRQRAFALVDTCEDSAGNVPLFSIFYKYGIVDAQSEKH